MECTSSITEAFLRSYIVRGLSHEQVNAIADLAEMKEYRIDEIIVPHGQPPHSLFVVLSGVAELRTPDGDKLSDVGTGSLLAEAAVFGDHPSDFDAVASGPIAVAEIPIDKLRRVLKEDRDLGFMVLANIGGVLCQRLHAASAVMHSLHGHHDIWESAG